MFKEQCTAAVHRKMQEHVFSIKKISQHHFLAAACLVILRYVKARFFIFFRQAAKTEERNLLLILPQITFGEAKEN